MAEVTSADRWSYGRPEALAPGGGQAGGARGVPDDRARDVARDVARGQEGYPADGSGRVRRGEDRVEVSAGAERAAQLAAEGQQVAESVTSVGSIRQDLVQRVRAELAAGTYETPEKLDLAVDAVEVALRRV